VRMPKRNPHQKKAFLQKNPPRVFSPKKIKDVYMDESIFRPQTKFGAIRINFVLTQGGIGDYICHMPAFIWIAEKNPHVYGRIFVNPPFDDVARHIMKPYPHFEVYDLNRLLSVVENGEPVIDPATFQRFIAATGAHLMDLGFMMYCNFSHPPQGYGFMPSLMHVEPSKDYELPKNYAVLTPGATGDTRRMKGQYLNELSRYLLSLDITPVYLGKKDFAFLGKESDYYAKVDEEFDPSFGIDLREVTTLLDTAFIIKNARLILGVDNGLLHIAGCTETPIIFGHTITTVEHRAIRRPKGITINLTLEKKSLPCIGCQSEMRFILNHRFKRCIYDDYLCLDYLFANDCATWKKAIDQILTS